jgi:hypothetical protein
MKTTYTIMAIFATALFTQFVAAKLGTDHSTNGLENQIEVNVQAEIISNINSMLENLETPTIITDVSKQLNISTIQFQTNQLVQNVDKELPEFRFKVVIAD